MHCRIIIKIFVFSINVKISNPKELEKLKYLEKSEIKIEVELEEQKKLQGKAEFEKIEMAIERIPIEKKALV